MAEHSLPRDTLVVRGPDRKTWLDGLLTNKVTDVAPGVAGYGLLLTKQGKIVTDAFLLDNGSELFVGVAPGRGDAVRQLLDRYLVMEDAELEEPATLPNWIIADGPSPDAKVSGALALRGLAGTLALAEARADLPSAADLLASYGLGVFNVDFGERDNPHEASLDRVAVSWTKGCYLGQEVVCMQDMRGKVKRRLVALDGPATLLSGGELPRDVLSADGSVVGQVSSIHASPSGSRLLASVATSALESPEPPSLSLDGEPLQVVSAPRAS